MAKKRLDDMSEAAMQVVEVDQRREDLALQERAEREQRIAECHEVIGRIQGFRLISNFADVGNLVWLRQVKDSKAYRDVPGVSTWDKFCERVGLSRSKVDEDLANLAAFGERFLADVGKFSLGYRDLRRLRQLTCDGTVAIEDHMVLIGDESIPLDPDHREDLHAAIEQLLDAKNALITEKDATLRAKDRVIEAKEDVIKRQEKEIARHEATAQQGGYSPGEEAFIKKMDAARITVDGFLMQFDPERHPLPEDASPRMCASLMETLGYFKRVIDAAYDTAADLYGDPEMDDAWVPPHMRAPLDGQED